MYSAVYSDEPARTFFSWPERGHFSTSLSLSGGLAFRVSLMQRSDIQKRGHHRTTRDHWHGWIGVTYWTDLDCLAGDTRWYLQASYIGGFELDGSGDDNQTQ